MSDGLAILLWWLALQVLGALALPLIFRLLRWLPDRGYALSKAAGLLLTGYLVWLLNTFGFMRNTAGAVWLAAGLVGLLGFYLYRRGRRDDLESLPVWLRDNRRYVLLVELLFVVAFVGWALVRMHSPEIVGTEKPMDLAFINAIGRSETFPPKDPWMSGFAISYYYFGYLLTAVLTKVTGVAGTVAFNLGLAWQFAGTLLGGFGLVYNLVAAGRNDKKLATPAGFGLLGSLMLGVMGNLEGFLEVLRAYAILPGGFWERLDIQEINTAVSTPGVWPARGGWWWWRASRVINDLDLNGTPIGLQPIDEFPFFSFILGDMHPHVLALPFVLLALGLGLNWWLRRWRPDAGSDGTPWQWARAILREIDPWHLAVVVVCVGALGFLNTWDYPFYFLIVAGALVLAQARDRLAAGRPLWESGLVAESALLGLATLASAALLARGLLAGDPSRNWFGLAFVLSLLTAFVSQLAKAQWRKNGRWLLGFVGQALLLLAGLFIAGLLAYLPFYLSFRSQAGGILPNVINPTRLRQFLVMFGPFLVILVVWLATLLRPVRKGLWLFVQVAGGLLLALLLVAGVAAAGATMIPEAQGVIEQVVEQIGGMAATVREIVLLRLGTPWTTLLLLALTSAAVVAGRHWFAYRAGQSTEEVGEGPVDWPAGDARVAPFVLLLVLVAALLTLAPEFVYLKDNFGARMNTVFKFYYMAWAMWAVGSAYAVYALTQRGLRLRWAVGVTTTLLVGAGLFYPVLAVQTRTNNFDGAGTLDGMAYMEQSQPADYAAIRWLQQNVVGSPVILEAIGPQYSQGGRFAAHTGLPTVLGWAGHEYQWRGDTPEPGTRDADVKTLYSTRLWTETQALLEKYEIEYVIVGPLEISTYGEIAAVKFENALETVFEADGVTIYRWNSLP